MQRLDATGNAMWQTHGILIADRSYSSTLDFDLAVDADGSVGVSDVTKRTNWCKMSNSEWFF